MTDRRIVILHGWSDTAESFRPLARFLKARLNQDNIAIISLANYMTMEDDVRFDDLATAMQRAWEDHELPTNKRSVDAIVHSAGALVIRDWLQRNFDPESAPIRHLVMLAPANFGSPVAHKGRAFYGRLIKGLAKSQQGGGVLETGTQILKGLELASPYTWNLAEKDRFGEGGWMYQPGNILCTVLVGNSGYKGIRAVANEEGSDGTVRTSTANMNCARITAEFPADPSIAGHDVDYEMELSSGMTAFGVMDNFHHSAITLKHRESLARLEKTKRDRGVFEKIVEGLTVKDDDFPKWRDGLEELNAELLSRALAGRNPYKYGFQNTVVHVEDQYGVGVEDFFLEFYEKDDDKETAAEKIHTSAIRKVHKYRDDESYRSVYIDCTLLKRAINKESEYLSVSLTASPEVGKRSPVGFRTLGFDDIGGIRIKHKDIDAFFQPHRTLFVRLKLARQQLPEVFRFEGLEDA